MPPTSPPAFEHLPAEIHGNILRQMASPDDVYSTIRASPKALGSFLCFREDILINALQTRLPPEIFTEYLGLMRMPKFEDFSYVPNQSEVLADPNIDLQFRDLWAWQSCRYKAWCAVVHRFLKTHFQSVDAARATGLVTYTKPRTSEKAEANYMVSTYGMLRWFIRQYQVFMRKNMTNYPHLNSEDELQQAQISQDWYPLSEHEESRLHRGFLRYEIFCRLNTGPDQIGGMVEFDDLRSDIVDPIFEYLDNWEEEEVRCIQAYVAKQYKVVARYVVGDYFCDVWHLSKKTRHSPDSEVRPAPDFIPADREDGFILWENDMASLGLPLLQQVLQSSADDQRRFFNNTDLGCLPPYFGFATLDIGSDFRPEWHDRANDIYKRISEAFSTREDEDEGQLYTKSWLNLQSEKDIRTGLRQTGWVFWEDSSRVKYFEVQVGYIESESCLLASQSEEYVKPEGHHISFYVDNLRHRAALRRMGLERRWMSVRYPETMYVTKEDHQELTDKYTAKPVEGDAEHVLLGKLRAVGDRPSKEVSPVFREICSRTDTAK